MSSRRSRRSSRILHAITETLELRRLLASTPFTADGNPWEITNNGTSWVEAENYDYGVDGGAGSVNFSNGAYHDTTAANQGGKYRNDGVDIEGPNTYTGNTYNIGYVNPGEWMNYTIKVDTAGSYVVNIHASNANGTAATELLSFNSSGAVVNTSNISVAPTGAWGTYNNCTATITLSAGTQKMTLDNVSGGCNFDYISFTPAAQYGAAEQSYNPTNPGNTVPAFRSLPQYIPQFGALTVPAEYFDTGGQANGSAGVQSGGYYWRDASQYTATYPFTATPFRATDTIDMQDANNGIVVNNWYGGDWAQYTNYSGTNSTPINPASNVSSYQAYSATLIYQLQITYSNTAATASSFVIDDTTGGSTFTQLGTISLPGTSGNYQTVSTTITLPVAGTNVLRLLDNDASGSNSHVSVDSFKLINSTTTGNSNAPWEIPSSGTITHIPADDVDVTPGSKTYPAGTNPTVGATTDTIGTGNDIKNLTTNDAVTYTINTDLSSQYNMSLRVLNTGSTPATIQVMFDSGAAFGATPDPVYFSFTVPVSSSYQTITLATNTGQNPQTTNNYVEIQAGIQKMQVTVLSGTINFHYAELSNITAQAAVKPDGTQSGSYAYQVDDVALNNVGDLFDRVYNTSYDWINPPANAAVPTNDWWTNLIVSQFAGTMYAFPESIADASNGVTFSTYSSVGVNGSIQDMGQQSLLIGGSSTTFTEDALLDYGDWTVHYRMLTASNSYMDVTMGRGMPYAWYEFNSMTPTITLQNGFNVYDPNGNALSGSYTGDHIRIDTTGQQIGVFAPAGTTFSRTNNIFTVTFAAGVAKYLVTAALPDSSTSTLSTFYQHAYSIPRQVGSTPSSKYTWAYNAAAGTVTTFWNLNMVAIDAANPPSNYATIQGWLPLNYYDGASGLTMINNSSSVPYTYPNLNGNIEISTGNSFGVVQQTAGINFMLALPQTIGAPTQAYDASNASSTMVSTDYSPQQMVTYIKAYITANTNAAATAAAGTTILNYGTDTYWGGKPMQEYAEWALMAKQMGDTADYNILLSNLTTFMTDWFTYTPGEANHYFAYYPGTHSLNGFNPSYGSENFTDNMFHYGYFTAAAGVLALLNPTWAAQYGSMAKMVAMQYANWVHQGDTPDVTDPNATSLPFLRTFEPWIGHSYAGGTSSGGGNNEESSSEAIQSWLGIILLGQALNDPSMTAAGMMGYTMESKAVREQWFNQNPGTNPNNLSFPSNFQNANSPTGYSNVAINFDNGKSYATYFGANPEYILGIEALPIWPSLDFLGRNAGAAAAATQAMLNERVVSYGNASYGTWASFETGGENDWLNIALGFQSQYDPQSTALQFARMIAQQTPTGVTGSTGLYYFQDHADQTYGLRNWNDHLSLPLGGVYSHGTDSTAMSNTITYMVYNPGSSTTVYVYNSADAVIDSFTAAPGFNTVTRSSNGTQAPPIITTGATASSSTVTGTTDQLSVQGTDSQQTPGNVSYTWSMVSGPSGAAPQFAPNGTNNASTSTVTFNLAGAYTFQVTATDVNGRSITTTVNVTVQSTLSSITVAPANPSLAVSSTQTFTATGIDQFGSTVTNPAVTWSVVSGGGSFAGSVYTTPNTNGSAVVKATSGSVSGTTNVMILQPVNVTATLVNPNLINLAWTAIGSATGYNIYRGATAGGESGTPLNTSLDTGTNYNDSSVSGGAYYYYVVKAVNSSGGVIAVSAEVTVFTASDLALNKTTTSSWNENAGDASRYAVDGNSGTRWSSYNASAGTANDLGWIYVDLGEVYHITEVKLNWENAAGKNYEIDVSNDASTWSPIWTVTNNTTAGVKDYTGLNGYGRYVRMYGTLRDSQYGYSLWDFNVYGAAGPVNLTGPTYLQMDGTVTGQVDAWAGTSNTGSPSAVYQLSQVTAFTETATSPTDTFTLDLSKGNVLAGTSGINFVGMNGGSNTLSIKGDNSGDSFQVGTGTISFGGSQIAFSNLSGVNIQTGTGNDTYLQTASPGTLVTLTAGGGTDSVALNANAGSMTLVAPVGTGAPAVVLSTLSIGSNAQVNFTSAPGHAGHSVMQVSNWALAGNSGHWTGTLDLGNNDLVVQFTTALANVSNQVITGAIKSSAAASDTNYLTTLGVMLNDDGAGHSLYNASTKFDGLIPSLDYTLVKYTWYGDTNLDGRVDGTDYSRLDSGYLGGAPNWHNGDLNGDGIINGSDYTLMDNAFNRQGAVIPAAQLFAQTAAELAYPAASDLLIRTDDLKSHHRRKQWQDLV